MLADVAENQWATVTLRSQPGVLDVALDEAAMLQHFADALSDLLQQFLQF